MNRLTLLVTFLEAMNGDDVALEAYLDACEEQQPNFHFYKRDVSREILLGWRNCDAFKESLAKAVSRSIMQVVDVR